MSITPRWLRTSQAAKYCGRGKNWLRQKADEGVIDAHRDGERGWRYFDRESIDAYFTDTKARALAIIRDMGL